MLICIDSFVEDLACLIHSVKCDIMVTLCLLETKEINEQIMNKMSQREPMIEEVARIHDGIEHPIT